MSNFNARFPPKPVNKRSVFERQRAEAEAKRQRDNAETAAVYEDFVKSFDDGGDGGQPGHAPFQNQNQLQPQTPQKSSITIGSVGGRRHFSMPSSSGTPAQRNSGPGSLGPVPGGSTDRRGKEQQPGRTLQNLQSLQKRRAFNESDDESDEEGQVQEKTAVRKRHDEITAAERAEERAAAKPTLRLANMPPGTSPATIKALIINNSSLVVDGVRILPAATPAAAPSGASATDRKALAAIVTLAAETPASDIDATVSALQNRYLGFGYYLNLHRHLSSAVATSSTAAIAMIASSSIAVHTNAHPFGAKPVAPAPQKDGAASSTSAGFAPPPSYNAGGGPRFSTGYNGRGVPPPPSYNGPSATATAVSRDGILHVPVRPPRDIKKLRMIHKVIENVLEQGPAFEALLMSRPEVQREEKWAWIWDARSEAGVWYRYRLWQTVSGLKTKRGQGKYMPVFEGSHAWKVPDNPLPYEFDTSLAELVSDSEYNSSDDSDVEDNRDNRDNRDSKDTNDGEDTFLNPLHKARLVHLLARLPTAMARLRKGDVARITAFAITHASRGADEVVDTIVSNVERPFAYTSANAAGKAESDDMSSAQLVAVYVVSDVLSSSATSGIRHAWRFRQLFDAALRRRRIFEGLGLLAERLSWGRLRADKWRRSIGLVLSQWEGWSVFSAETHEHLVSSFENALTKAEAKASKEAEAAAGTGTSIGASASTSAGAGAAPKKSRWKTVDTAAEAESTFFQPEATLTNSNTHADRPGSDNDNEWDYRSDYTDDEALDLACMDDEDIDGEPMDVGLRDDYLDGTALSADDIHALVGSDIGEMSEEGEIGSDDNEDDYYMSFSSDEEPAVEPAPTEPIEPIEPVAPTPTPAPEPLATLIKIQGGAAEDTGRSAAPRKRMRAADMFADAN
ncbi:coatamer subunit protein [Ophiostoma piceae UAMH 11346]|uniref:Coatamer subunit protein n=1 Tax=Ophiostoma piceae (strain UAMH 11346) TaxID=1262450 RepID=S3BQY3_OPHP1|nr:coatamer subunit protein [Ophiostoma piceae UAMH 11346]